MQIKLSKQRISKALATACFGRRLIVLARTGSTNDILQELARKGAPEGTVVLAEEQTAGRGRMGRSWIAPAGTCLLASILFRPQLPLHQMAVPMMLTALAAADAIKALAGLEVALKWPNDLIVPGLASGKPVGSAWRKVAGLLAEASPAAEGPDGIRTLDSVVVGIGINVNVRPEDLSGLAPDATSILAETGHEVDREALLCALLTDVEQRMVALGNGESPHCEWADRLVTLGSSVRAVTATSTLTGVAQDVDESGALLLQAHDGSLHRLTAGDVTLA